MTKSAMTLVHKRRLLPTKQYQCGRNFVDNKTRELNQAAAVSEKRTISPVFALRAKLAFDGGGIVEACEDIRTAAFLSRRNAGVTHTKVEHVGRRKLGSRWNSVRMVREAA